MTLTVVMRNGLRYRILSVRNNVIRGLGHESVAILMQTGRMLHEAGHLIRLMRLLAAKDKSSLPSGIGARNGIFGELCSASDLGQKE